MNENINALNEINKGCHMGMDSINFILDKVRERNFRKELLREYKEYETISKRIENIYSKYENDNPDETNTMNKVMIWTGIEMKTITDESTSKLAELMLEGVNMGVTEGRKILNNKTINKEVHDLISIYVNMQEKNVEELKVFL